MEIFYSEHVRELLHNKFVVIIGDSIQRAVYKDLIQLLQSDCYTPESVLKTKGEHSCLGDELIEGGQLEDMTNKTTYREVRQYQTPVHLVRFYFVTRCYSDYVETILMDLSQAPQPDLIIMNSCLWDITRYGPRSREEYKKNLQRLCRRFTHVIPHSCLIIWHTTMPIAQKIRGGFLVKQIQFMEDVIRLDAMEANFYAAQVMDDYGFDVLDLHFYFRRHLQHRKGDGVHWDTKVHRRISNLLLAHVSQAWGVALPRNSPLASVDFLRAVDDNNNRPDGWSRKTDWSTKDVDMRMSRRQRHLRSESMPVMHTFGAPQSQYVPQSHCVPQSRVPQSHCVPQSRVPQSQFVPQSEAELPQLTYSQSGMATSYAEDHITYNLQAQAAHSIDYSQSQLAPSRPTRKYLNPRYMPY